MSSHYSLDGNVGISYLCHRKHVQFLDYLVCGSINIVRSHLEFQKDSILVAVNEFLEKDTLFDKTCSKVGLVKEIILK